MNMLRHPIGNIAFAVFLFCFFAVISQNTTAVSETVEKHLHQNYNEENRT